MKRCVVDSINRLIIIVTIALAFITGLIFPASADETLSMTVPLDRIGLQGESLVLANGAAIRLVKSNFNEANGGAVIVSSSNGAVAGGRALAVFSVSFQGIGKPFLDQPARVMVDLSGVVNDSGLDRARVYRLVGAGSKQAYWSRDVVYGRDPSGPRMVIPVRRPGTYKVAVPKASLRPSSDSNKKGFFYMPTPTMVGASIEFQLNLAIDSPVELYLAVEDSDESEIHSDRDAVRREDEGGWLSFSLPPWVFNGDKPGKYKIKLMEKDLVDDDDVWSGWFIREEPGSLTEDQAKTLLERYSPLVFYGNHNASTATGNPWHYEDEDFSPQGDIYYPIDVRDLVSKVGELNLADGVPHVTVGVVSLSWDWTTDGDKIFKNNYHILNDMNDLAAYNDVDEWRWGVTVTIEEGGESVELLEERNGFSDKSLIAAVNSNNFPAWLRTGGGTIYASAFDRGDYIYLQYFLWFPFDPKNGSSWVSEQFSRHSGDWERVALVLRKNSEDVLLSKPEAVVFGHHLDDQAFSYYDDSLGYTNPLFLWNTPPSKKAVAKVPWSLVKKTVEGDCVSQHPHIYVCQGSHAIYPRQGTYGVWLRIDAVRLGVRALLEYAGGQGGQSYSFNDGNMVYLPRMSQVDSITPGYAFMIYSGYVAQTEPQSVMAAKIGLPPYNNLWYDLPAYYGANDLEADLLAMGETPENLLAPILVEPENDAVVSGEKTVVEWGCVPGAVQYYVEVTGDGGGSAWLDAKYTKAEIGDLKPGEEYFWRVKANNGEEDSEFSELRRFTCGGASTVRVKGKKVTITPLD